MSQYNLHAPGSSFLHSLSLSLSHTWTGILNAYWQTNLQLVIIAGCFCWSPYSLVVCRTWQQHQQQQRSMGSGGAQVSHLQEATAIHGDLKTPPTKLWACKVQWPSSSWVEDCHLCSRKEGRNWASKQARACKQTNPLGFSADKHNNAVRSPSTFSCVWY